MLALGVLALVMIDLIILITYTAVEGARGNLSAQRVTNRENPKDVTEEVGIRPRKESYKHSSRTRYLHIKKSCTTLLFL